MSLDGRAPSTQPGSRGGSILRWKVTSVALATMVTGAAVFLLFPDRGAPAARQRAATARPRGSRQAERIVFASRSDSDDRYHIHLINPDGTGETVLTSGPEEDKTPAWSPNRQLIAFTRTSDSSNSSSKDRHIYIMRADGTGLVQVTDGPGEARDPSWSPDGTRLVFTVRGPGGMARLVMAAVDGSHPSRLPKPPAGCVDQEPSWSPDGLTIAFARRCGQDASGLYLMHLDGTGVQLLSTFGRTPDWSPDGARIAYTGLGSYGPAVFVINADGTGKQELTGDFTGDPVWSPDGTRIVFTVSEIVILKLYVINVDGTGMRALTSGSSSEVAPSW